MIVICVLIQVTGILLAILSRIHFSKYKGRKDENKASLSEEKMLTYKYRMQMLIFGIAILFGSASLTELFVWKNQKLNKKDESVITRTGYTGDVRTEAIWLTLDDEMYAYSLEINPREYTEEEFYELAEEQIVELKRSILGDNTDLNHITGDLQLPREDAAGIFTYSWISDRPQIVSSYGAVHLEEVTDTAAVLLTLRISYLSFELEEEIPLVVREMRRENAVADALESLRQLELNTRTEESITLPKEYGDVQIELEKKEETQGKRCLLTGVILALLTVPFTKLRIQDAKKKRDDALRRQYPSFVNTLWLLLGSGMSIQMGIRQVISGIEKNALLKRELEYAMHQIENGSEEAWTYEQLGRRLEVPEYYQLMQHLSQHIRMGTKDLRNLMETEAQTALKKRREFAKKQGEEASTKLLFPMVVLLAVVMLIIIYPAMAGF